MNLSEIKLLSLALVMIGTCAEGVYAGDCTVQDEAYAESWGDYYDPQDAYDFGIKIQELVVEKDLDGLFQLVDGELESGPRRKFAAGRSFEEIFPKSWVNSVLSDKPSCAPIGWRGFMLGSGRVWFNKTDGRWRIFSVIGASKEVLPAESVGWKTEGRLLHPLCFARPWMSGDNFEELIDRFAIANEDEFFRSPGAFLGKDIKEFEPIIPSWCEDHKCEKIALVNPVTKCAPAHFDYEIRDGGVWLKIDDIDGFSTQYVYSIVKRFDLQKCSQLAPNVESECVESFLVEVGDYSGGSMGWDMTVGIYGIFDLQDLGPSVLPLRYFSNRNEALNYLDNF